MKKYFISILIFLFLVLFQQSFLSHFKIFGSQLNLILVFIFLLSFESKDNFYLFAGTSTGIILDLSASSPFGTFTLTFVFFGYLVKELTKFFQKSNALSIFLIFFFSFFVYQILPPFFGGILDLIFKKEFTFHLKLSFTTFFLECLFNFLLLFILLVITRKYELFPKT